MNTQLIGLAGISGSGKTSIIAELSKATQVNRISSTKILMEFFDILKTQDEIVKKEDYIKLESISMKDKINAYSSDKFIELIEKSVLTNYLNIFEIHFVSPNVIGKNVDYQTYSFFDWYFNIFDGIAYITSEIEEIVNRKMSDFNKKIRDRGDITMNSQSAEIQKFISDMLWNELNEYKPNDFKTKEINNSANKLKQAVNDLFSWIKLLKK